MALDDASKSSPLPLSSGALQRLYDMGVIDLKTVLRILETPMSDGVGPPILNGSSPSERSLVVDRLLVKTKEGKRRIAEREAAQRRTEVASELPGRLIEP